MIKVNGQRQEYVITSFSLRKSHKTLLDKYCKILNLDRSAFIRQLLDKYDEFAKEQEQK